MLISSTQSSCVNLLGRLPSGCTVIIRSAAAGNQASLLSQRIDVIMSSKHQNMRSALSLALMMFLIKGSEYNNCSSFWAYFLYHGHKILMQTGSNATHLPDFTVESLEPYLGPHCLILPQRHFKGTSRWQCQQMTFS